MNQTPYIIAVDGPAGAGKSAVCSDVARELGILHLDTGATYRTFALGLLRRGISPEDKAAVESVIDSINVEIGFADGRQQMLLDGENVTDFIRTNEVSAASSACAVIPAVRLKMVELQRKTAESISMIVDGRDVGTYVFPHAEYKFFLTAEVKERAKRRFLQLKEKGISADLKELEAEIAARDKNDSTREMSPLRKADDAILIDTTNVNQQQVVNQILKFIAEKRRI